MRKKKIINLKIKKMRKKKIKREKEKDNKFGIKKELKIYFSINNKLFQHQHNCYSIRKHSDYIC